MEPHFVLEIIICLIGIVMFFVLRYDIRDVKSLVKEERDENRRHTHQIGELQGKVEANQQNIVTIARSMEKNGIKIVGNVDMTGNMVSGNQANENGKARS